VFASFQILYRAVEKIMVILICGLPLSAHGTQRAMAAPQDMDRDIPMFRGRVTRSQKNTFAGRNVQRSATANKLLPKGMWGREEPATMSR
jgi:hypothetical protein